MNVKAVAALLLLTVSMAAADAPATVADALTDLQVSAFSRALNKFPDLVAMVGPNFAGTVFAPTNKGWNTAVKAVEAAGVTLTDAKLKSILLYHIIPGPPAPITGLNDDQIFVSALDAETVVAQYTDGKLTLEGVGSKAEVVTADTNIGPAHYGVVHTINNMLLPFVLPGGSKPEPGGVKEDTVSATSLDTSTIGAAASSAVNAVWDSGNAALGSAQAGLGSGAGSVQDAAAAAANAVQQAAAGMGTAVTGAAGTMVDGAMGAVAGVGAPDAADVETLAAGLTAGPTAAPSPQAAPGPVSAPESLTVPTSSASTASVKYVALAVVALGIMLF